MVARTLIRMGHGVAVPLNFPSLLFYQVAPAPGEVTRRDLIRLPTAPPISLDGRDFPVPVMGKTGTTRHFRDALFVTMGRNARTILRM